MILMCRYRDQPYLSGEVEMNAGLVGHVRLNEVGTSFFSKYCNFKIFKSWRCWRVVTQFLRDDYNCLLTGALLNRGCWKRWTSVSMRFSKNAKKILIQFGGRKLVNIWRKQYYLSGKSSVPQVAIIYFGVYYM